MAKTDDGRAASAANEALITVGDAAHVLGVSVATMRVWDKQGLLPSMRTLGGHRRYRRSDVLRAREQMEAPTKTRP